MSIKPLDDDTIVAVASAPAEAAIGIVRLSGKQAILIADTIFKAKSGKSVSRQKGYTLQYGHIVERTDTGREIIVDEVVLAVMRAPASFTREDTIEISAHGGAVVLRKILELAMRAGARQALKGEFTKRAFLNGRLDLLQAEAVLEMVAARTQPGAQWASLRLEGVLSRRIQDCKRRLLEILSHLEAQIDFPDDMPDVADAPSLARQTEAVRQDLQKLLASADTGLLLQHGLTLVLCGRPNVGKSSLFNALARHNRAIVTPVAGTTRDVLEADIQVKGLPVKLKDTAGLRSTDQTIEKEGIERAKQAVAEADMVAYLIDRSCRLENEDVRLIRDLNVKSVVIVLNKTDLPAGLTREDLRAALSGSPAQSYEICETSCLTEDPTSELEEAILRLSRFDGINATEEPGLSSVRQKLAITKAVESLANAVDALGDGNSPELIAVDVRLALDQLGVMVGEIVNDDMLEILFNRFCIGK